MSKELDEFLAISRMNYWKYHGLGHTFSEISALQFADSLEEWQKMERPCNYGVIMTCLLCKYGGFLRESESPERVRRFIEAHRGHRITFKRFTKENPSRA